MMKMDHAIVASLQNMHEFTSVYTERRNDWFQTFMQLDRVAVQRAKANIHTVTLQRTSLPLISLIETSISASSKSCSCRASSTL